MSLKAFHIVFVTLSTLLSLGFAGWAIGEYLQSHAIGMLAAAVGAVGFAAVLICYGLWFLRKLKGESFL